MLKDGDKIFETGQIILKNVYKVSQEQNEILEGQSEKRVENARKEALTKIRERYNQRLKEIQNGGKQPPTTE